jgi:hypothetical protein
MTTGFSNLSLIFLGASTRARMKTPLFQSPPPLLAGLGEARGEDLSAFDPLGQAVLQDMGHQVGGHHDVGHVDGPWDLPNAGVHLEAQELAALGVDGVDAPPEAEVDKRLEEAAAELDLAGGGADDGCGLGVEKRV